jgi:phosphoglycerate dehydrogenase-like enzyme
LINTARGGVINEQGLKAQLDAGKVRFAALDVFENEPTPDASLLIASSNGNFYSAHRCFYCRSARDASVLKLRNV